MRLDRWNSTKVLLWMAFWASISIVCSQLPLWGSIASIIAASVVVLTALAAIVRCLRNCAKNRNPIISPKCWIQPFEINNPRHADLEYNANSTLISYITDHPKYGNKIVRKNGKYHLYLELTPQFSLSVEEMNLRFIGNNQNIPQICGFYDANNKPSQEYRIMDDGVGGKLLRYSPIRNLFKGKDIYYIITFQSPSQWKGQLSIRFYFISKEARSVRIPCIFN